MSKWTSCFLLALLAGTARAQGPSPEVSTALAMGSGIGLPLASTLVIEAGAEGWGFGLMAAGLVLGPAPGFFHAGLTPKAVPGLLIRAAAVGGTALWIASTDYDDAELAAPLVALMQMLPGAVVVTVSGALDFGRLAALLRERRGASRASLELGPAGVRLVVPLP